MKKLLCFLIALVMVFAVTACKTEDKEDDGDVADLQEQLDEMNAKLDAAQDDEEKAALMAKIEELQGKLTKLEEGKEEELDPYKEKITIRILSRHFKDDADTREDTLYLEEKFNVDIKPVFASAGQGIELASAGNTYDIYVDEKHTINDLYETGAITPIKLDDMKLYMPNLWSIYDSYSIMQTYMKVIDKTNPDKWETKDEVYGVVTLFPTYDYPGAAVVARLDWLEDIGITFDDLVQLDEDGHNFITNTQLTFDQFNEAIKLFTENDPDGNSESDTYGSSYMSRATSGTYYLYTMFGINASLYASREPSIIKDKQTGEYMLDMGTTQYKECMMWIDEMRDKGYLKPETKPANIYNDFNAGLSGFALSNYLFAAGGSKFIEQVPAGKAVIIPPPVGPDGDYGYVYTGDVIPTGSYHYGLGACVDTEEEYKRCLAVLDCIMADETFYYTTNYGPEDIVWKFVEDENGNKKVKFFDVVPDQYTGWKCQYQGFQWAGMPQTAMQDQADHAPALQFMIDNNWMDKYNLISDKLNDERPENYFAFDAAVIQEKETVYRDNDNLYSKLVKEFWALNKGIFNNEIEDIASSQNAILEELYNSGLWDKYKEVWNKLITPGEYMPANLLKDY